MFASRMRLGRLVVDDLRGREADGALEAVLQGRPSLASRAGAGDGGCDRGHGAAALVVRYVEAGDRQRRGGPPRRSCHRLRCRRRSSPNTEKPGGRVQSRHVRFTVDSASTAWNSLSRTVWQDGRGGEAARSPVESKARAMRCCSTRRFDLERIKPSFALRRPASGTVLRTGSCSPRRGPPRRRQTC
jgi:hypothetical protein